MTVYSVIYYIDISKISDSAYMLKQLCLSQRENVRYINKGK